MSIIDDLPDDVAFTPQTVATFLGASGWSLVSDAPAAQMWQADLGSQRRVQVRLPLDSTFLDFRRRFDEALRQICRLNDWDTNQLISHVLGARSDILYVRADQTSIDGSIPIKQAEQMLTSVQGMLLAAATSALRPSPVQAGRRPDLARDFVANDVRMGHTQRGSFIITILARLDEDEVVAANEDEDAAPADEHSSATILLPPFQRRVMATLASGLNAAEQMAKHTGSFTLDDAIQSGLSLNLVDAITEISTGDEGLRGIDLSFNWAIAEKAPPPSIDKVSIARADVPQFRDLRARLERQPKKPATETIYGQVTRLERGEEDDAGVVTIRGLIGTSSGRTARVQLSGRNYMRAIQAHRGRTPVTATGILERRGNANWITGDVRFAFA